VHQLGVIKKTIKKCINIYLVNGKTSHKLQQKYHWEAWSFRTYDIDENILHHIEVKKIQQTQCISVSLSSKVSFKMTQRKSNKHILNISCFAAVCLAFWLAVEELFFCLLCLLVCSFLCWFIFSVSVLVLAFCLLYSPPWVF
jgi:hypothetical protein